MILKEFKKLQKVSYLAEFIPKESICGTTKCKKYYTDPVLYTYGGIINSI